MAQSIAINESPFTWEGTDSNGKRVKGKTVAKDEWLDVSVDLTKFAGQTIKLAIENVPNNWMNEWAYWHSVKVVVE